MRFFFSLREFWCDFLQKNARISCYRARKWSLRELRRLFIVSLLPHVAECGAGRKPARASPMVQHMSNQTEINILFAVCRVLNLCGRSICICQDQLGKSSTRISVDGNFKFFFSAETICMKCQILFSKKNKKNKVISLSSAEFTHSMESVNGTGYTR